MDDDIIQEVCAIREQHAARFGYDLDRIFADLKARQEKHQAEGWIIISPPVVPPSQSDMSLQQTRFAQR